MNNEARPGGPRVRLDMTVAEAIDAGMVLFPAEMVHGMVISDVITVAVSGLDDDGIEALIPKYADQIREAHHTLLVNLEAMIDRDDTP